MRLRARQRGAALMAMLVIVVLGGAWWLVSGLKAAGNRTVVDRAHNAKVLAEAKAALIAWAAQNAADPTETYPGRLPCPEPSAAITDAANAGIAAPNAAIGNTTCSSVGRLPWRTLGLDKLQDAAGEPLWYVVDASTTGWALANSSASLSINSNKAGTLTVDGNLNAAVAVILAPGAPMTVVPNASQTAAGCVAHTQQRTPSAPTDADYLECLTTSPSPISVRTQVIDNAINKTSNDQMVVVTAAEVLAAVEPVVAQRILKQVVPQMQSVYASSTWGASGAGTSAANPAFPFAVTFGDPGTGPTSAFKGTVGKTEGLMPVTALTCTGTAASRCDPNFHTWTLPVSLTFEDKTDPLEIDSGDCSASTTSEVSCTVTFTRACPWVGPVNLCFFTPATVKIVADAGNVGMAMRTLNAAAATGLVGTTSLTTFFPTTDGTARVTYTGGMISTPGLLCGASVAIVCSGTMTVTIPLSGACETNPPGCLFKDHSFINPATSDTWYWFFANNWHHVTYYAFAPPHKTGGAGNCSGTSCISVTVKGDANLTDKRAVLALAGRSLLNTSGTNRALTDFLDGTENPNLSRTNGFEQYKSGRTFNDRFVSLSP